MITIWGRQNSSNVRKVLWCCAELDIPFERKDVGGGFGGLHDTHYARLNPNAKIPTIEDGDFVLWESNAIVRYLASRYGAGTLWPVDPIVRADADRWMDWQITTIRPPIIDMVLAWLNDCSRYPESNFRAMEKPLRTLDAALSDRAFVAGDDFTMGDIPLGLIAYWWYGFDIDHYDTPNVRSWYDRLCERPGYVEHVLEKPFGPASDHEDYDCA